MSKEFKKDCPKNLYMPTILQPTKRIIAIGDIHGDFGLAIKLLKIGKVIDNNLQWIGKDTHVVQVGDLVDLCRPNKYKCDDPRATINDENSDIKIIKFYISLDEQARKDNGRVICLLGNHELMQVNNNLNYVSYKGLIGFKDYKDPDIDYDFNDESMTDVERGKHRRAYAFSRGNEYARMLGCNFLSAVIIGNILFAHAGIIPEFASKIYIQEGKTLDQRLQNLEEFNTDIRKWLLKLINKKNIGQIINSKDSLFWNRILGKIPNNLNNNDPRCEEYVKPVLKLLNIKHMIIGHTPQPFTKNEGINGTCNNSLYAIDHGSSHGFDTFGTDLDELRKPSVLEILNDGLQFNILK